MIKTNQIKNQKKARNYQSVPLSMEILAGCISGFLVSPFNSIVDRTIIQNASGKRSLWKGVGMGLKDLFKNPITFMSSYQFRWVVLVYTCTYTSGNLIDHYSIKGVDDSILKLFGTFIVNTTLSLMKDKSLTQRFGTNTTQVKKFPMSSYGLFFLRDIVAMASAFTIPPILADYIQQNSKIEQKNALRIAQIISPLLIQFIGTPLHLLGIDMYVNPNSLISERYFNIKKILFDSLSLRMLRFLPTYGLGGIVNIQLRNRFKQQKY